MFSVTIRAHKDVVCCPQKHNPVTCQSVTSWMYTNNKRPHALVNLNETQTHFSKRLYHFWRKHQGWFYRARKINLKKYSQYTYLNQDFLETYANSYSIDGYSCANQCFHINSGSRLCVMWKGSLSKGAVWSDKLTQSYHAPLRVPSAPQRFGFAACSALCLNAFKTGFTDSSHNCKLVISIVCCGT